MQALISHHFYNHGKPESDPAEAARCHFCQIRTFATHKTIPIAIVNEEDDQPINTQFRFIDHSVVSKDVPVAEDSFRTGCGCEDDENCMYGSCQCLDEMDEDSDQKEGGVEGRVRRQKFAYFWKGAKAGLLRSRFLEGREPIYECHDACSCSSDCPNRVVQRGRTVPLTIFRTSNRGWGVRSPIEIKKGQFVDRYLGEIITREEADRRRAESTIGSRKDVYLFALDKFTHPDSLDPWLRSDPREVDGEWMSGPTRFINHSCEPNMRIFARVGDKVDKHIHDLALFAIRDIPAGEELTFDYVDGGQEDEFDQDSQDPEKIKDMTPCLCGTKKCRGFLW
ncbi:putative H3 3mK9 histone methyl transferase [Cladorrhinum sp. PSN259]|nr:putative H3 3mK9 histone methyl transferase [Cladorrhinum sp. PSN259]